MRDQKARDKYSCDPKRQPWLGKPYGPGSAKRVKTYGELVTSIINPSHRLARGMDPRQVNREAESKVLRYNEIVIVQ